MDIDPVCTIPLLQGPCSATSAQLEHTRQDQAEHTLRHALEVIGAADSAAQPCMRYDGCVAMHVQRR